MSLITKSPDATTQYPVTVVREIIPSLVQHPDEVTVEFTVTENAGLLLTIGVSAEDHSNVIGKGGRTFQALRTILHAIAARNDSNVKLEVSARRR